MKDKLTAAMLAMFLGVFGAHKFYLGETGSGCGYLALSVIFPFLPMIIGFMEGLQYLTMDQATFDARYNGQAAGPPLGQPLAPTLEPRPSRRSTEPWYATFRPRGFAEREQVLLAVIRDLGGSVTPAEVVLHTQLSLQQARDGLQQMELLGVCQTEYDPATGLPRYVFPELRRRQTGAVEPPLEESLGQL